MSDPEIPPPAPTIKPLPSVERLRELLAYDPETGVFRWKVGRRGGTKSGSIAGWLESDGYRKLMIDGANYAAHRLAWKMMTGKDPVATIDHENNHRDDNHFANLREATRLQQSCNKTAWGSSKFLGVSWNKKARKWHASIRVGGNLRHLGGFTCEIEAARTYDEAAKKHFGEFANLNFPGGS